MANNMILTNSLRYNSMNGPENIKYFNNSDHNIVIVTAFFNIHRDKWGFSERGPEYYINSMVHLFTLEKKIILFCDDQYVHYIEDYINKTKLSDKKNIIIVKINKEWLYNYTDSWKKNEISEKIMASEDYYKKIYHRRGIHPENTFSEYNTINHSKIDFIKYAIDNNLIFDNEFVCWCDSGYYYSICKNNPIHFPSEKLDIHKFNLNTLNFCIGNKISEKDDNMIYQLRYAPVIFTGCFFAGTSELMKKFHILYHQCLDELYNNNITDDDQHVYLRCFFKEPQMFELFLDEIQWPNALKYFQTNNRYNLVKNIISNIENGVFVEIGTHTGEFADFILENSNNSILYCIDPYLSYESYDDAINNFTGDELFYKTYHKLTNKYGNRIKFIRKFSEEAYNDIPLEIDFLYIDGNHRYKYVYDDLNLYFSKVKKGNYIIGDDAVDIDDSKRNENGDIYIEWCPGCYGNYGVIKAFREFCELNKLKGTLIHNQYVIKKD